MYRMNRIQVTSPLFRERNKALRRPHAGLILHIL